MNTPLLALSEAVGKKLAAPILQADGRKILAKGHLLAAGEVGMLADNYGVTHAWVAELEPGEVPEEEVLGRCAALFPGLQLRAKAGGQASLVAEARSVLLVHRAQLEEFNASGVAVLATRPPFSLLEAGESAAVLRTRPYCSPGVEVTELLQLLARQPALLEARPIEEPKVVMLCTDPVNPARARELFVAPMRPRWAQMGVRPQIRLAAEEEAPLQSTLAQLVRERTDLVVVASTVSPAGPADALGRAVRNLGGSIESFLAPVEPGTLLMLSRIGTTTIASAPGCCRNAKPNVLDLILPPLLARHKLTATEISALGAGGLLEAVPH